MKKHTLSLAIVGTLASSLILSQAVLAEEVETSTEATSSEEVTSDESVAESVADETSAEDVSESEGSSTSSDEGEAQQDPEREAAREAYNNLWHDANMLSWFDSFWTDDSLSELDKFHAISADTSLSTEEIRRKSEELKNTLNNLKNNFNYTGSWHTLIHDKELITDAENSKEYFELLLLKDKATQLLDKGVTPESQVILKKAFPGLTIAPNKEWMVTLNNHLRLAIANAIESPEVAEYYSIHRHAAQVRETFYNSNYTEESKDNFDKILEETNISFDDYFNEIPKTIAEYQLKTQKLKEALAQLVEKPKVQELPYRKEYLAELERSKELLSQWKWERDRYLKLQEFYKSESENYSEYKDDDYKVLYTILKDLNDSLVYSPEQEALGKLLDKVQEKYDSLRPWDDQVIKEDLNTVLTSHGVSYSRDYYRPDSDPATALTKLNHVYNILKDKGVNVTFSTDKSNITVGEDKEITIVVTLITPIENDNLRLDLKIDGDSHIMGMAIPYSESEFTISHKDNQHIVFKLPVVSNMRYFNQLSFNLSSDTFHGITIPLTVNIANPFAFDERSNYVDHASLDKHEISQGESLRYNMTLSRSAMRHFGTVDIYRVGENTPFKSITVTSRDNSQWRPIGRFNPEVFHTKNVFGHFTIDESFPAGEYEIRSGRATRMFEARFGKQIEEENNIIYVIPPHLYQRFTVKAKAQAETEKEDDTIVDTTNPSTDVTKTDEQPKVDNTKPVEDKKTEEQPKVDNTTPEGKPSVDVKPLDMPTGTKGDEKKDEVTKVKEEKTEMTTPSTSAPSTPTVAPAKPAATAQALPETGELDSLFGLSALAILASIGLVAPTLRRHEQ